MEDQVSKHSNSDMIRSWKFQNVNWLPRVFIVLCAQPCPTLCFLRLCDANPLLISTFFNEGWRHFCWSVSCEYYHYASHWPASWIGRNTESYVWDGGEKFNRKTRSHHYNEGFPGGASGEESACPCKRCKTHRFNPWEVGIDPGIEPVSSILACKDPMDRGAW